MFKKRPKPQKKAKFYPSGTFISTEQGYFYVVNPTKRFRITTQRVLDSWNPARVVQASEGDDAVKRLKVGVTKMKFRSGALIQNQEDGKLYLVSDNKLRHIQDPDWLAALGASRNDAVWVSKSEIEIHDMGEPLT